ncbi:hypothetical protein [Nostoc sp.]|uniref:hypothetical protein n=1 Tax=Nostoc sp. TaxID=1180 RepID=UPI002FFA21E2
MKSARFEEFRQVAYKYLGRAKDATFELTDAILLTRNVYSLADLSLSPIFRRKWSSIYEALQDSRPQRHKLMQLYIKQIPTEGRLLLAGDHTNWSRPDAVTLQERTYEHSGTSIAGNKPITVGQRYSTIAWIPEDSGSWALPLRHERITSWESPIEKAIWLLLQVCEHLPTRISKIVHTLSQFLINSAVLGRFPLLSLNSSSCDRRSFRFANVLSCLTTAIPFNASRKLKYGMTPRKKLGFLDMRSHEQFLRLE